MGNKEILRFGRNTSHTPIRNTIRICNRAQTAASQVTEQETRFSPLVAAVICFMAAHIEDPSQHARPICS